MTNERIDNRASSTCPRNRQAARLPCVAFLLAIITSAGPASPQVVVPHSLADVDGPSNNGYPFSCDPHPSMRYQQVYQGQEVGTGDIVELRFRQDYTINFPFIRVLPDVEIMLSSTPAQPDGLDNIFDNNVGADVTIVANGDLRLSSDDCDTNPCPFDITITLSQSFSFDAAQGLNLLLDVIIPDCRFLPGAIDASDELGDSVSRAAASAFDRPAGFTDSTGLVTEFIFAVFIDGFESGDLSAWSEAVGGS